ncbi:MAG: sulfopyruvate decarboxylase subunit alpha [Thermoanaerobaculaceae bacterium]
MNGSQRLDSLRAAGVEFVSGVPCSYLKRFFAGCGELPPSLFLPAVREDHAVAACAGAWLGGKRSLAAMQNSGLGYCLEVLTSLHLMYGMPLPMIVSDRGDPKDYEEHRILGQRTRQLLDLFEIPWLEARPGMVSEEARWLVDTSERERRPAVLLVGKEADV